MSDRSILVLGATGMLGRAAVERLRHSSRGFRVEATSRIDDATYRYDVADGPEALGRILASAGCRYVLNAIGVLNAEIDERRPASVARAVSANAHFPHVLALAAVPAGCRVFHVSTDAVFSGRAAADYLESTPVDPVGVYGLSKALGEVHASHVLNLRCSIVGRDPRGKGLIEWVLRAPDEPLIEGYTDYVWTPATVPQLVDFVRDVMVEDRFTALRAEGAIVHFAPNPPLSKFDFVAGIDAVTGRRRPILPVASPAGPCRRVLGTKHRYPSGSSWPEVLRELFSDVTGVNET